MIIHLNGWPGAGKKTIGLILAEALKARFIHNHLLHDVGIVCAGIDSPDRWTVYENVRSAAYAALVKRPPKEIFVMTNALCKTAPREVEAWHHVVDLALSRGVPLVPVVLEVEAAENIRRVQSADRVGKKMTDVAELQGFFALDQIQYPDVSETFAIDVTRLGAAESATRIFEHLQDIRPTLQPATHRHLQLR